MLHVDSKQKDYRIFEIHYFHKYLDFLGIFLFKMYSLKNKRILLSKKNVEQLHLEIQR